MQGNIFQVAIHALLAVFGSMARQLNNMSKTPLRPASFIAGCIIASFMGVIFYFIADNFKINGNIAYAAAGIMGWIGPNIMDKISQMVMQAAGVKLDDETVGKEKQEKDSDVK